jgi:energy-coupling factor transporter ATP-binding protein EcfA2
MPVQPIRSKKIAKPKRRKKSLRPAYFLSMTIENVRCFKTKQEIDLSDGRGRPAQWSVILGDNGVGKTTILQSLASLVPRTEPFFGEFITKELGKSMPVPQTHLPELRYPSLMVHYGNSSLYEQILSGRGPTEITASVVGGTDLVSNSEQTPDKLELYFTRAEGRVGFATQYDPNHEDIVCFGYGASRRMGDSSLSDPKDRDGAASLFDDQANLLNAEEWLLQCDYAAHAATTPAARRRARKLRDEVKDVLINLLPDVEDVRYSRITEKAPKPKVEFKTPYGWVSLNDVSYGYKTLIAWMVDFASRMFDRYPESPNPLREAAVVLVDEIDLHLHPKWQRKLMRYLSERFPNTQFIVTAHSPLVVQAANDANIILLKRAGNHVVVEKDVTAIDGWRVDQILTSDLFGLESARSPHLDPLLKERTNLLSKSKLSKADTNHLHQIEAELGSLPTGETPEDIEAMDIIRRAAERLKTQTN